MGRQEPKLALSTPIVFRNSHAARVRKNESARTSVPRANDDPNPTTACPRCASGPGAIRCTCVSEPRPRACRVSHQSTAALTRAAFVPRRRAHHRLWAPRTRAGRSGSSFVRALRAGDVWATELSGRPEPCHRHRLRSPYLHRRPVCVERVVATPEIRGTRTLRLHWSGRPSSWQRRRSRR